MCSFLNIALSFFLVIPSHVHFFFLARLLVSICLNGLLRIPMMIPYYSTHNNLGFFLVNLSRFPNVIHKSRLLFFFLIITPLSLSCLAVAVLMLDIYLFPHPQNQNKMLIPPSYLNRGGFLLVPDHA